MKTKVLKRLSFALLACVMLLLQCASPALAAARSSNYLDAYGVYLTPQSGGKIVITSDVNALRIMTNVGVSKIYLYESQNGTDFYRIATYKYEDYPIMMGHNAYYYYEDILTFTGTPGYKYYIIAYCYAEDSTGYDQKAYTSAVKTAIS